MKSFQFRFEALLKKIHGQEHNLQRQMSPFVKEYNRLQSNIDQSLRNLQAYQKENHPLKQAPSLRHLYRNAYENLQANLKHLRAKLVQVENALKPFQEKLKHLFLYRYSIEKIKEKDYMLYRKEYRHKQQALLEESFHNQKATRTSYQD